MPNNIQLLPPEVSVKIAAGEVIERPASIVKELVENALDAQATFLHIELAGGGKREIVVQDNGTGISSADVPQAFQRFATSKISSYDDLFRLSSLGFRGEALPSIASVARVEMTTRTAQEKAGTYVLLTGGKVSELHEIGCPTGTSVKVTEIFAEVPARLKFLKSDAAEQAYCMEQIIRILLGYRGVRAEVMAQGKSLLFLPATADAEERIALLLGRETARHLIAMKSVVEGSYRVHGFLSEPMWSKTHGREMYCFVNGRPVRDPLINHALITAYRHILPPRRYPVAVLYLDVPPEEVDVNVHPSKMEVRFQHPQSVYGLLTEGIIHTLSVAKPVGFRAEDIRHRVEEAVERYYVDTKRPLPPSPPPPREVISPPDEVLFLAQLKGTYLVFLSAEGLIIVDQHAAHERILYDRLQAEEKQGIMPVQTFLVPPVMSFSPHEYEYVTTLLPYFTALGIELEPFGPGTIAVKSFPAVLSSPDPVAFIRDIIADLKDKPAPLPERRDQIIASLACHSAVRAHHRLTPEEAATLWRDLKRTTHPATCPHGRPTSLTIAEDDLERMFKRR